jgi:hypothetical protein
MAQTGTGKNVSWKNFQGNFSDMEFLVLFRGKLRPFSGVGEFLEKEVGMEQMDSYSSLVYGESLIQEHEQTKLSTVVRWAEEFNTEVFCCFSFSNRLLVAKLQDSTPSI